MYSSPPYLNPLASFTPDMNEDAITRVIHAMREAVAEMKPQPSPPREIYKKIPMLTEATPDAFHNWRKVFEVNHEIAGWNNSRARLEASAAMIGDARDIIDHIPTDHVPAADEDDAAPVAELLDRYRDAIQPPLARERMMADLRQAKQREEESVVVFAGRIKRYFCRLFPARAAACETDTELTYVFREGIRHQPIRDKVREAGDQPLQQMVATALIAEVTMAKKIQDETGMMPNSLERAISAISKPNQDFSGSCFICNKPGHRQAECNFLKKAMDLAKKPDGKRRNKGGRVNKPYKGDDNKASGNSNGRD